MKRILLFVLLWANTCLAQTNLVTYAGNNGKETFYDVMQMMDCTSWCMDSLNCIDNNVPKSLGQCGNRNLCESRQLIWRVIGKDRNCSIAFVQI